MLNVNLKKINQDFDNLPRHDLVAYLYCHQFL